MKRSTLSALSCLIALSLAACSLNPSTPATSIPTDKHPSATPLNKLPPTWTPEPTLPPTQTPLPSPTVPSPTPTATPSPTRHSLPEMTPVPVTLAPQGNVPDDWQLVEGNTASFKVPPAFEVMDLGSGFGELFQLLIEGFVEGFSELAEEMGEEMGLTPAATQDISDLEDLPGFDFVMAFQETDLAIILVIGEEKEEMPTLNKALNEALAGMEGDYTLLRKENIQDGPQPMARAFLTVEDETLGTGKQLIYFIQGEGVEWTFFFGAPVDLFESYLPQFEMVISTLDRTE